jgi:hypothetical protein
MIINPEGLIYHISLDFHAPSAAAGSHAAKCEEKESSHYCLRCRFCGIMEGRLKENMRIERNATKQFFQPILFVAISQVNLRYAMGVKYEEKNY